MFISLSETKNYDSDFIIKWKIVKNGYFKQLFSDIHQLVLNIIWKLRYRHHNDAKMIELLT